NAYIFANPSNGTSSYTGGLDTDFGNNIPYFSTGPSDPSTAEPMKQSVRLHRKRFSGAIRAYPNGTLYQVFSADEPRYAGTPGSDLDDAWDTLLGGRYIRFLDSEVTALNMDEGLPNLSPIFPNASSDNSGQFYGGPDMLHSLHCLNIMRKQIDIDYYRDHVKLPQDLWRMHIDHCIEHLRQAVMCHGDLTPVTLRPIVLANGTMKYLLGETERLHTCRNGEVLREWVRDRGAEMGQLGSN
ncbi:hypothetical protein LTS18_012535, partial [Coniosporium uncinatum]